MVLVSASISSNLLHAANWLKSDTLTFNSGWINADNPYWANGNVLTDKNNNLICLAPIDSQQGTNDSLEFEGGALGIPRYELSAKISVSVNTVKMYFDQCADFVHFPGSQSKYTIRYDSVSQKYWSVINKISQIYSETNIHYSPANQRNMLMLVSSSDLVHWTENAVVVSWNRGERLTSSERFAFQDADWQFDGDDIAIVSNTAWYSSPNYKKANYITFHTIKDYRSITMFPMPEDMVFSEIDESMFSSSKTLLGWYMNTPDTQGGEAELNARIVDENIQTSKITRGDGLNSDGFTRSFFSRFKYIGSSVNTKNYALENNAYFEFTVSPKENVLAVLDTLKFKLRSGSNGPYYYRWLYSIDDSNLFKELGSADGSINYSATLPDGIVQEALILTGENALKNIPHGVKIVFRLYVWGATNTSTSTISIGRSETGTTPSVVLSLVGRTQINTTLSVNQLVDFKAEKTSSGIKLVWQTGANIQNTRFDVLHSTAGTDYDLIATLNTDDSKGNTTYQYLDRKAVSGVNYYKINFTDINGKFKEHGPVIISEAMEEEFLIEAYPVSGSQEIQLLISSPSPDSGVLIVSDVNGQILFKQDLRLTEGQTQLKLPVNISSGRIYIISYKSAIRNKALKIISK